MRIPFRPIVTLPSALGLCLLLSAGPAAATPLITGSEENHARLCLDYNDTLERIAANCQAALDMPGISEATQFDVLLTLAWAQYEMDEMSAARDALELARSIRPETAGGYNLDGWLREAEGDLAGAEDSFRKALALSPDEEAYAGLATVIFTQDMGRAEDAMRYLDLALLLAPDYGYALREKGWQLFQTDDYEGALLAYDRALGLDPDDLNALYVKARVLLSLNQPFEAIQLISRALEQAPESAFLYMYRAMAFRMQDFNMVALASAEKAISLNPELTDAHVEKARALMGLYRYGDAVAALQALMGTEMDNGYSRYWYALALADDEQYEAAREAIEVLTASEGAVGADFELKAFVAMALDRDDVAQEAVERALSLNPELSHATYYKAVLAVRAHEVQAGMAAYRAAMELEQIGWAKKDFIRELIAAGYEAEALALGQGESAAREDAAQ